MEIIFRGQLKVCPRGRCLTLPNDSGRNDDACDGHIIHLRVAPTTVRIDLVVLGTQAKWNLLRFIVARQCNVEVVLVPSRNVARYRSSLNEGVAALDMARHTRSF